jgi:hypothetical protein
MNPDHNHVRDVVTVSVSPFLIGVTI